MLCGVHQVWQPSLALRLLRRPALSFHIWFWSQDVVIYQEPLQNTLWKQPLSHSTRWRARSLCFSQPIAILGLPFSRAFWACFDRPDLGHCSKHRWEKSPSKISTEPENCKAASLWSNRLCQTIHQGSSKKSRALWSNCIIRKQPGCGWRYWNWTFRVY